MEQRVSEIIREMGEMRRRIKGIEGKIYRMEEENKEFAKRIEMLEEESLRKVGEKEGLKEAWKKRGEELKEIREVMKKMTMKESESEMEEGEWEEWAEDLIEEEVKKKEEEKKDKEEEERRARGQREEREREWRRKVLIIKRGAKASKVLDIERWVRKVLGNKQMRILKTVSNRDATKVFFTNEREKEEVWERRELLRKEEDMIVDRWMNIEERKERFKLMERTSRLKEEFRRKGFKLVTLIDEGTKGGEKGCSRKEREVERGRERAHEARERKLEERRERTRGPNTSMKDRETCGKCCCGGGRV